MTDTKAFKKGIKKIKTRKRIKFIISGICFLFVSLSSTTFWTSVVLIIFIIGFLVLGLVDFGNIYGLERIFNLVRKEGECSVPNLVQKLNRSEESIKDDIKELIKIGAFPSANIVNDIIILADIQQETPVAENRTTVAQELIPTQKADPLTDVQKETPVAENRTTVAQELIPAQKVDLNTASEQELTMLPGVGVALAKRAIEIRAQINGFVSAQDFCERLALMPHFTVQIENISFVTPVQSQVHSRENVGRVVDI